MASTRIHQSNDRNRGASPAADVLPHSHPQGSHVSDGGGGDFIDQTIAIWQTRSNRPLTREDGREITENITGFFRVLQEWDRAERSTRKEAKGGS